MLCDRHICTGNMSGVVCVARGVLAAFGTRKSRRLNFNEVKRINVSKDLPKIMEKMLE